MGEGYLQTRAGGGSFLDARDAPDAFVANALLKSNSGASALEFSAIIENGSALVMGTRNIIGTDGAWDVGAIGGTRPGTVWAESRVRGNSVVDAVAGAVGIKSITGTGLGSVFGLFVTNAGGVAGIVHQGRTNAAGNKAIASVWDADLALSSVNSDMILHDFVITDNVDADNSMVAIKPHGVVRHVANFAVAGAPSGEEGDVAYCTNGDAGSKCLAFFDGTSWLRIVFGAAISAT